MPSVPSIKGTVFATVLEDVSGLVAGGKLCRADLTRWLRPEDLPLLDQKPLPSAWYDIRAYTRMSELLRDVIGGGSSNYLREVGRRTARQLITSGKYPQLQYARRAEVQDATNPQARFEAFGRDLGIITSLSANILNFSRWAAKVEAREHRYMIEVSDARDVSDVLCWRSEGFINEIAAQHGHPDLWGWTRDCPDVVLFRMIRSL